MSMPPYPPQGPQDGYPPRGPQDGYPPSGPYPPQQGPYPPQGPYGGGYGVMPMEHPQGTMILILGILSLVICQLIGPFAWSMGNNALREIDSSPAGYSNRGMVQAGRICGMIATIIMIALVVIYGLLFIGLAASSS